MRPVTWTAKNATIGTSKIPYLETGDPESPHTLLLIHAFPVGMRVWEPVTVPHGWRALAPALPGFDGTDPPPASSTSIDDYGRSILAFMDHLHLDSAILGGLSIGGYISFALWRLDRLRWRGLVLADTRPGPDSEQGRAGRERMLKVVGERGTSGVADEMIPKLLGKTTRAQNQKLVDHVHRLVERQTKEGVAAALVRLRDRPDSTPQLGEIGVPVLLIVGEEDEVTPPRESEEMKARLEDARLVVVPEAGHLSCMEQPAAFNAALAAFLNESRG
jgi:3-oxoadipate enol-lactonase